MAGVVVRHRWWLFSGVWLGLFLTSLALSGCGDGQASKQGGSGQQPPSDADLAVGMPAGGSDDGSVPSDDSLAPPPVSVAADEPTVAGDPTGTVEPTGADEPTVAGEPSGTEQPSGVAGAESAGDGLAIGPPPSWQEWDQPQVVLAISGQQYGYIEPCGCTGLANQKGGLMRRYTMLEQVRQRGWEVVPLDAGNQVRRAGRQASIKFQTAVKGLQEMGYRGIGLGPEDLQLGASELLSVAADDGEPTSAFVTANIELLAPGLVPQHRVIAAGGRKIGVTTAIDPEVIGEQPLDDGIVISDPAEQATASLAAMKADGCDFAVMMYFGSADAASELVKKVTGYDLIVAAKTYGEPYYQAELIEGTETRLVKTGDKGMYLGLVGLFADGELKYSRVPLDDSYEDARPMVELMASYQEQLKALGLSGLQLQPMSHPSGEFVGTARCGECHTKAYQIWQGTPHAEATDDIVHPGERSEIPRHFDPECLSCHVTGWDPQGYKPYTTGYLSLDETPAMTGSGCENCHGPGKAHAEAEEGGDYTEEDIQRLRESVRLTLDKAQQKCLECHDIDNSPDFHKDGAFEEYWSQIEHYGVD